MSFDPRVARRLALVSALSAAVLTAPAFAAGRVHSSHLSEYDPADGFIVGYRNGSLLKSDATLMQRSLTGAVASVFGRSAAPAECAR